MNQSPDPRGMRHFTCFGFLASGTFFTWSFCCLDYWAKVRGLAGLRISSE